MNSSRVVKNIFRRVSSAPLSPSHQHVTTQYKTFDSEIPVVKISRNFNLPTTVVTTFQVRTMATASTSDSKGKENRLALEKSPYLLQHATNPVDWYPWCEEAFEKARKENKLIFLSVGYSTCHWCHVMEKESFENDSVAEIMNRHYINIKVDREERPDIDRVYMSFIQATAGSGGWPMSVFLTPNLEPITGGTYFPPEDKWGRPGFKTILNNIAEQWCEERSAIAKSGKQIVQILKRASDRLNQVSSSSAPPPFMVCVERCMSQYTKSYEPEFGGFSSAPKFPQPSNFNFLFHVYSRDNSSPLGSNCLRMSLFTLKCMANGGIHDHVSSGFARYSTDSKWHVPHFEKMLYDQGQLTVSYLDAYLATKDQFYADVINDILLYVSRDLSHDLGGFYSAEDADSLPTADAKHKKEGAFCVWTYDEIIQHVTGHTNNVPNAEIFCYHFNIKKAGNVNPSQDPHNELTNKNVLITSGIEGTAAFFETPVEVLKESLKKSLKMLYEVRQSRPRPHLDSKILTAWNGLMITGFAKAGEILKSQEYIDRALKAANFVKQHLYIESDKTLLRCCYRSPENQIVQNPVPIVGFLDDYAFFIRSLIDLYESTLDASWLEWAEILQDSQDRLFWDQTHSGYFTSAEGDTSVLIRVKDDQDGAEPCGNSVSTHNLLRLGAYLDRADMKTKAEKILGSFNDRLQKIPIAVPVMMSALILYHDSCTQVFIVGERSNPATEALLEVIRDRLIPGRVLVLADGPDGQNKFLYNRLEILSKLKAQGSRPTAYVCHRHACSLPVTQPAELVNLLEEDLSAQRRQ